jgi:hypothetical protein
VPLWFTYARLSQRLANSRICLWENRFFSKTAHPLTIGRGYFSRFLSDECHLCKVRCHHSHFTNLVNTMRTAYSSVVDFPWREDGPCFILKLLMLIIEQLESFDRALTSKDLERVLVVSNDDSLWHLEVHVAGQRAAWQSP